LTNQQFEVADPVFILCAARTGSTVLRLMLDCHPELTCPAETNLAALCNDMIPIWCLVTGNPAPVPRQPLNIARLPEEVKAGLRKSLDLIISTHIARSGKPRWCDKSLASARHAELMRQLYPRAKFLCLYRFPMDLIASALEACPYGLTGYGYDPFVASSPGNSVLAVARCWLEMTADIMTAEENFPEQCLRIRYEDLVEDPDSVMAGVFGFLGVPSVPDIATQCFSAEPERLGMADYKIWHTSRVGSESVGRGWTIPARLISQPVLEGINELSGRLGYIPIRPETWGVGGRPDDVRVVVAEAPDGAPASSGCEAETLKTGELVLERVQAALAQMDGCIPQRWAAVADQTWIINVLPYVQERAACVQVSVNVRSGTIYSEVIDAVPLEGECASYVLSGSATTWSTVLSGAANFGVEMRMNHIRFSGPTAEWATTESRIAMISDMLGLTSWQLGRADLGPEVVARGMA
jgi:hypothetical protein